MRLICIFLVCLTHICNNYYTYNDCMQYGVWAVNTVCIVAVPCFFMIAGYFSRKGQNPVKKIWNTFIRVTIPTWIAVFVCQFVNAFLSTRNVLAAIDFMHFQRYWNIILNWRINKLPACGPFWYSDAYLKLIMMFPIYSLLCSEEETARTARKLVYLFTIVSIFLLDINHLFDLNLSVYSPVSSYVIYYFAGYEMSQVDPKKLSIIALLSGFLLGIGSMFLLTAFYQWHTQTFSDYFFHYTTIPCVVASTCAFGLFMKINVHPVFDKSIVFLGGIVFYVYLYHIIVRDAFLWPVLRACIDALGVNALSMVIGALIVCLTTFAIVIPVSLLCGWMKQFAVSQGVKNKLCDFIKRKR